MFDIARVPVARQKAVGDELAALVPASDAKPSKKGQALPADVLALSREVLTRTRALEIVQRLPEATNDIGSARDDGGDGSDPCGEHRGMNRARPRTERTQEFRRRRERG